MISPVLDFHHTSPLAPYYASNKDISLALSNSFRRFKKISTLGLNSSFPSDILNSLYAFGYWASSIPLVDQSVINSFSSRISYQSVDFALNTFMHDLSYDEFLGSYKHIFSLPHLLDSINFYLGNDGLILYEASHFLQRRCFSTEKLPTSSYWHRDPVGSHIKIFLCLHNSPVGPSTGFVPYPFLDPVPREWEMIRANKDSPLLLTLTKKISDFKPLDFHQAIGSILVIDTNCIHRGSYQLSDPLTNLSNFDYRHLLQFSFMNESQYSLYNRISGPLNPAPKTVVPRHSFPQLTLSSPPFSFS